MSDKEIIDHSVSDLAKVMQRSRSSILSLIQAGHLEAYDSAPEGKHRQYRVTPEALDAFRAKNSAAKPKAKSRRKPVPKPLRQWV